MDTGSLFETMINRPLRVVEGDMVEGFLSMSIEC